MVQQAFERAIGTFLARVCVSAHDRRTIAVAYSGGLDSTVLLYLASRYAKTHDLPIHAFHVHHGLSANADAWADLCRLQAQRFDVALEIANVLVADRRKRGVEEAARIARYDALGNLCRSNRVSLLLTAHHRDDQAETVLLQLMRGAGMPGLSGMPAFQARHELLGADVALGRPLLDLSRRELEKCALQFGLPHVTDDSNSDVRYMRNALRHDIAPAMERHFPGFSEFVARTAAHAQTAQALLSELAAIDHEACKADRHPGALDLAKMSDLSATRLDNLVRHWLYEHGLQLPSTARLTEIRGQMLDAASDKHPFFDFGTARLHRIENRLELHPNLGIPPDQPISLKWRGEPELVIPQWAGRLIFEKTGGAGLDAEKLHSGLLTLRPRIGRERLKLAANRPSKSLKNLFQESSIATWRRAWLPLLYVDEDLVFAAGLGMDSRQLSEGGNVSVRWDGA